MKKYNADKKAIQYATKNPFLTGLVAKIGSDAALSNFEAILNELDADKDAIMID